MTKKEMQQIIDELNNDNLRLKNISTQLTKDYYKMVYKIEDIKKEYYVLPLIKFCSASLGAMLGSIAMWIILS